MMNNGFAHNDLIQRKKSQRINGKQQACAVGLLLLLSGCVSNTSPPSFDMVISNEVTDLSGENTPKRKWWYEFDDPQLHSLIEQGLANNPSFATTIESMRQAQLLYQRQSGTQAPILDIKVEGKAAKQSTEAQRNTHTVSADLSYEVDIWNRLASLDQEAYWTHRVSHEQTKLKANLIAANITVYWYRWWAAQLGIELLNQQIFDTQQRVKLAKLQYSVGQQRASIVLQEEEQLRILTQSKIGLQTQWHTARAALALWLSAPVEDLPTPPKTPLPQLDSVTHYRLTPAHILDRADVKQALAQINANHHAVRAAVANQYPQLTLSASSILSGNGLKNLLNQVTGTLVAPVLNGSALAIDVKLSQSKVQQATHNYRESVNTAVSEVLTSMHWDMDREQTVEQISAQLDILNTLKLTQLREFQNGVNRFQDVLLTQRAQSAAEKQLLDTQLDWIERRVTFFRAVTPGPDITQLLTVSASLQD